MSALDELARAVRAGADTEHIADVLTVVQPCEHRLRDHWPGVSLTTAAAPRGRWRKGRDADWGRRRPVRGCAGGGAVEDAREQGR